MRRDRRRNDEVRKEGGQKNVSNERLKEGRNGARWKAEGR